MVDTIEPKGRQAAETVLGRIPSLSGDIRHLIPKLGLREYWYPAIPAHKVGKRKPVQVKMLGEELALFRDKQGKVVALTDACPHRGARLSEGICHYDGLLSCPYHGWTFDGEGKLVAVLSEGHDSRMPGLKGTEAKVYPSRELKGVVFVWIGEGEPVPIEEDIPEEFFDPQVHVFYNDSIVWGTNWEVALENSMDSHVGYLHRDSLQALLANPEPRPTGAMGTRIVLTGTGTQGAGRAGATPPPPRQEVYPELGNIRWPKHNLRRLWWWFFAPFFALTQVSSPRVDTPHVRGGHNLPGIFGGGGIGTADPPRPFNFGRGLVGRAQRGSLFGGYRRWPVAIGEWHCRVWYFHGTRPRNRVQLAWFWFLYWSMYRWLGEYNFSQQDMSVMPMQYFDKPEMLSVTDTEVTAWRRLVVTKHFGGRTARFEFRNPDGALAQQRTGT